MSTCQLNVVAKEIGKPPKHPSVSHEEESPLKKKLRQRQDAARMQNLEIMGNSYARDKLTPSRQGEVKEKHLETLKNACTEKYYSDSQKKVEVFLADERAKVEAAASPVPEVKQESMLMKNIPTFTERNHSRSALKSAEHKNYSANLLKPDPSLLTRLVAEEKDDRYLYLIRNGTVKYVEAESYTIFVELPQIPHVIIAYRRPNERVKAKKQFNLSRKKLEAVPLFEGEEMLEELDLGQNLIHRIENLVSLPKLLSLNLSFNKITQMGNMNTLQTLKTLNLSNNCIASIEGMEYLKSLESLNLQSTIVCKARYSLKNENSKRLYFS